jgi:glycosyltransferase involved in cell wall biosynthesis
MRVLAVQIANGYSAEARVLASLLGWRGGEDVLVLHHSWAGDRASADKFAQNARGHLEQFDAGWRPNPNGKRSAMARIGSRLRFRTMLPAIRQTARNYGPNIVISCQQRWDCGAAASIARHLAIPQVIYLCYNIGPWLGDAVLTRLLTCDHVIAVSDFIRDQAVRHGVAPQRVTTIRPAMRPFSPASPGTREEVRAELGVPLGARVIGMVARLDPSKGQKDTIAAFAKIAPTHPEAHLVIVGGTLSTGGTKKQELQTMAARLGLSDRVLLTGERSDIQRLLTAMDIFIHPSRQEPFALAPLEAAAAGLPVVAYAEGGFLELIANDETGILITSGDIGGLADSLASLLENPDVARRIGAAGKEQIRLRFQPEQASQKFMEQLRRVAGCASRPGVAALSDSD